MDFTIAFAVVSACSVTACLQFLALSPGAGEAVSDATTSRVSVSVAGRYVMPFCTTALLTTR